MRILVFGGSGQVGYYLVKSLKALGYSVYSVSRTATADLYCDTNYILDLAVCSTNDLYQLCDLIRPNVIIYLSAVHGASTSIVMNSSKHLYAMEKVNQVMPDELIRYCELKACKFVFSSSSYVYSPIKNVIRYVSEDTPLLPLNIYGKQKAHVQLDLVQRIDNGFDGLNVVLFNNISRLRKPPFLIPRIIDFLDSLLLGQFPSSTKLQLKSSRSIFDLSCTLDVVYIITQLVFRNATGNFILGSGNTVSVLDVVDICFKCRGLSSAEYVLFEDESPANASCVSADNTKVLQLLDAFSFKRPELVLANLMT